MEKKIIFIDLDGTLVLPNIPLSNANRKALLKAKNNGHKLFICTGRNYVGIEDELFDIGFDGIITSAGGHIVINDEVIYSSFIEADLLSKIKTIMEENNIDYCLEGTNHSYITEGLADGFINGSCGDVTKEEFERLKDIYTKQFKMLPIEQSKGKEIHKVSFIAHSRKAVTALQEAMQDKFLIVIHELFSKDTINGELIFHDVNKATGIQKVLEYMQLDNTHTVAIGDSMNDSHMLEYCDYSIAIKHAPKELKELADYVTVDCHEDAISDSFKHLEII